MTIHNIILHYDEVNSTPLPKANFQRLWYYRLRLVGAIRKRFPGQNIGFHVHLVKKIIKKKNAGNFCTTN